MNEKADRVQRGIILAGGTGSRLYPLTAIASKQLLPVYDKPMVYYPLSMLIAGGIREILLISTPKHLPRFEDLLGDGSRFGVKLQYAEQPRPEGIAQALIIGREFLAGEPGCLILGDNIFYGYTDAFRQALQNTEGATIFGYAVKDPRRYGVVEADDDGTVLSIEEKPQQPKSDLAVPGIYVYDGRAAELAGQLEPSARGELEITDLNRAYLQLGQLRMQRLGREVVWLDAGTFDALLEAAEFVAALEQRQSVKLGCPEEAALRAGFLSVGAFEAIANDIYDTEYAAYLKQVATEFRRGPKSGGAAGR